MTAGFSFFIVKHMKRKKRISSKAFTKSDLISALSEELNITKALAGITISNVLDSIAKSLKEDRRVEIRNFGTFEIRKYSAYEGHNPQTGEKVFVPAKKTPFFKVGKLKEQIKRSS